MKICPNCAKQNRNDTNYCTNCGYSLIGAPIKESPSDQVVSPTKTMNKAQQEFFERAAQKTYYTPNILGRSVPMSIVLTLVTCGIYGLYWMMKENDDLNALVNDQTSPTGGIVILLSIVTCGIYSLYWYYKMGEKADYLKGGSGDTKYIYLLFGLFGLGIITSALIQDEINKAVNYNG